MLSWHKQKVRFSCQMFSHFMSVDLYQHQRSSSFIIDFLKLNLCQQVQWRPLCPPLGSKISLFSCSFREKIIGWRPPSGVGAPLEEILDPPLRFFVLTFSSVQKYYLSSDICMHLVKCVKIWPVQNNSWICQLIFHINSFYQAWMKIFPTSLIHDIFCQKRLYFFFNDDLKVTTSHYF